MFDWLSHAIQHFLTLIYGVVEVARVAMGRRFWRRTLRVSVDDADSAQERYEIEEGASPHEEEIAYAAEPAFAVPHAVVKQDEPVRREPRYANVVLLHNERDEPLAKDQPLPSSLTFRLRLDIGPLSAESQVMNPDVFPDDKLPDTDIDLDVLVSSTDFAVSAGRKDAGAQVAHGYFLLPRDGNAAVTRDKGRYLIFYLTAPEREGPARCRIGYYYRNVLVQSQILRADVGYAGDFCIEIDYTMSENFAVGLGAMPERQRISVLANDNGDGLHQIVLRKPGVQGSQAAETFTVRKDIVSHTIEDIRQLLANNAPTAKLRRKAQLVADLKALASLGWSLYGQVPGQRPRFFSEVSDNPEDFVIQVARPSPCGFAFPWGLIYEIPITSGRAPRLCQLVDDWDGDSPLVTGDRRTCPHGPHTLDQDILCPFGFWGYRYSIDQVSSVGTASYTIPTPAAAEFVMGETQYQVSQTALAQHVTNLTASLKKTYPGGALKEAKTLESVREFISHDLPLVYFYCHGERNPGTKETCLGIGHNEVFSALDFVAWVKTTRPWFWDRVRPLVFINACHSLEITSDTLISYLDAFFGSANAAGVIGTEVKVAQDLAMDVAEGFFKKFLTGQTVDQALRAVRMDYLASGNLLGLSYTPYCWSELKIMPAP